MIAGKRKLCYTDVSDFADIQSVGNDPIYKRFSSVHSIIKQYINTQYQAFLAEPIYSEEEGLIYWYTEDWGNESAPIKIVDLDEASYKECKSLLEKIKAHYDEVATNLSGIEKKILKSAIKYIDEQFIYSIEGQLVLAVWGMKPDQFRHNPSGTIVHEFDFTEYHNVIFNPGLHGTLENKFESRMRRRNGSTLTSKDIPKVIAKEGFEFISWDPSPIGVEITQNLTFNAIYQEVERKLYTVNFVGDDSCEIDGQDSIKVAPGTVLTQEQLPRIILNEGYSFVSWDSDITAPITNDTTFKVICQKEEPSACHVKFVTNEGCNLLGDLEFDVPYGQIIPPNKIPQIECLQGYKFTGWTEDIFSPLTNDLTIYPNCEEIGEINVDFNAGEKGVISGESALRIPRGTQLLNTQIPIVTPKKGYKFIGWDTNPLNLTLDSDFTFNAKYEEKLPWWKRIWTPMFSLRGCLSRLLVFLLLLLLLLFLLSLFKRCDGIGAISPDDTTNGPAIVEIGDSTNTSFNDIPGVADDGHIGDVPSTPIDTADLGRGIDPGNGDNDYHAGVLPPDQMQPPIDNPDDPNGPQIIPNIINIFFSDDNANLNAFAKDFRSIYPDTQKYLLEYDDLVKRVSIAMPSEEREALKENIQQKLGEKYDFFIVDETVIQHSGAVSTNPNSTGNAGWHLRAVRAPEAWLITSGDPGVVVAVVDDGIDLSHSYLKNKIISPYNVFTKNGNLTKGSGHGTHTAGLAVGSPREDQRAAGIAPGCRLIPVQVFSGEQTTISAMISGIAYAIHNGAHVVNVSIGPKMAGYRNIPPNEQIEISKRKGKAEEQLWNRVLNMAEKKNTIIVFSAGNDNVIACLKPQNRPEKIISVTAVNPQLQKSIFGNEGAGSDYGNGSTVAAPGSEIYSTIPVNDFGFMEGTSMAAPIVSGVVALLKSVKPDITISETIKILTQSGKALSDNTLGPLVQADRALYLLKNGTLPSDDNSQDQPTERPSPGQDQPGVAPAPGQDHPGVAPPPGDSDDGGSNDNDNGNDNDNRNNDRRNDPPSRDYSDIFRKIAELERQKHELIKQLPPEEQKRYRK